MDSYEVIVVARANKKSDAWYTESLIALLFEEHLWERSASNAWSLFTETSKVAKTYFTENRAEIVERASKSADACEFMDGEEAALMAYARSRLPGIREDPWPLYR
jgi:hypothetical protein